MSDFVSAGWGWYVAILTVVSIVACGVLLYAMGRMRVKREKAGAPAETTGHVWDGDLVEFNNPLPRLTADHGGAPHERLRAWQRRLGAVRG